MPAVPGAKAPPQPANIVIEDLFAQVPLGTSWSNVPEGVKAQFLSVARQELAAYDCAWNAQGLRAKRHLLSDAPTAEMKNAIDTFIAHTFSNVAPAGFQASDVPEATLRQALTDCFLADVAENGSDSSSTLDWDGSPNVHFMLPSPKALQAAEALAHEALTSLEHLDPSKVDPSMAGLVEALKSYLTSLSLGTCRALFGSDMRMTPWGRADRGNDLMRSAADSGPHGNIFKGREADFLRTAVAWWLSPLLDNGKDLWNVNAGTIQSALKFILPSNVGPALLQRTLGDPATVPAAKAFSELVQWFSENLAAHPDATKTGYALTPSQQERWWASYQADNDIPKGQQGTLQAFHARLDQDIAAQTAEAKVTALHLLDAVFPVASGKLTDAQHAAVAQAVQGQQTFGTIKAALVTALDAATGSTAASTELKATTQIQTLGGPNASLSPADEDAKLQSMLQEVKAYIAKHYPGPVNIASLLPDKLILDRTRTGGSASHTGDITIGLQAPVSLSQLYGMIMFEGLHAIDFKGGGQFVGGATLEGAAKDVQDRIVPKLLNELYASQPVTAAAMTYDLMDTNARFAAATEAMLAVITAGPNVDAVALVKDIGRTWGKTSDADLNNLVARAFTGMQYLQYLGGKVLYLDLLDYLQKAVNPPGGQQLDPFVLRECGVFTPGKDPKTVQVLQKALASGNATPGSGGPVG